MSIDFEDDGSSRRQEGYLEGRDDGYVKALEDALEEFEGQFEELSIKGADAEGMVVAIETVQEMLWRARR